MNFHTLNYQNDRLILRLFGFLYAAGLLLQLYWDQHFILQHTPELTGLYIFLCGSLVLNPFLKSKWSVTWIASTIAYFIIMQRFLLIKTSGNLNIGGSNHAMVFWVLLTLSAQKWLGPSRTVFLIKFLLLFSYFAGGVAKARHGFDWMNGWTLRYYFLNRHLDLNTPEGWWLVADLTRAKILSWLLVSVELLTPLAFLSRRLEWAFVLFYASFQLLCMWLMKLKFMNYYGWSYMIYVSIALVYLYQKYQINNKKRASSGERDRPVKPS